MKIIDSRISYEIDFNQYFKDEEICFIDIETTGLSRTFNNIYLIGVLFYDSIDKVWILRQILGESINEEREVLIESCKLVSKFNRVITYNGESFDLPFINNKLGYYNIDYRVPIDNSFDLYRTVRANRYFLNFENLKLKTIEEMIGIIREDIYSGKDCIQFYQDYIITKEKELEDKILKHNYDDLYYLPFILKIIDYIKEIKSIPLIDDVKLFIEELAIVGDSLVIKGAVSDSLITNILHYDNNYRILVNEENQFEIGIEYTIGLVAPTKKGLFIQKKELALSGIIDSTNYDLPDNILLLKVEKEYCIDNIKAIIRRLILNSLEVSY